MSSFIKDYFRFLKKSDEKTKNRSAIIISFVFTLIILFILFIFLKDSVFNFSATNEINNSTNTTDSNLEKTDIENNDNKNDIASPFDSLSKFFKDSGEQISKIKKEVSSNFSSSSNTSPSKN